MRDAAVAGASERSWPSSYLALGMAAARRLVEPERGFGRIAPHALSLEIEATDPDRPPLRDRALGGLPLQQRLERKTPRRAARPRAARRAADTSAAPAAQCTSGERMAPQGSRIASPAPWIMPPRHNWRAIASRP